MNHFSTAQFLLDEFCRPYRADRFANGGGILLYVRDDISSCLLTEYKLQDSTECLFIEINIRKRNSYSPAHITPIKIISLSISTV